MADEVGRFVVGIDADPSGLAAGLAASGAQIKEFADVAATDIARANAAIGATAPIRDQGLQIQALIEQHRQLARTIGIEGEQTATTFRASTDALASQLVKLGATEKELDVLGKSVRVVEQRYIAMAVAANAASNAGAVGPKFLQTSTLAIPTPTPEQLSRLTAVVGHMGEISVSSGAARVGLERLRLPLTTIADRALGTSRAFGALSSGILSIGLGTGVTIALIATISALALAYNKLTEDSTKARDELDKLIKSLDEAANKRIDVVITMSLDTATLEKEQSRLQKEAAQLQQSLSSAALTAGTGVAGVGGGADAFAGSNRRADIKRLTEIMKALAEVQASVRDNDIKTTNESVSSTATLVKGQSASNRERQIAIGSLAENKRQLAALNATEEAFAAAGTPRTVKQIADLQKQRVAVQQNITELTDAFKVKPDNSLEKFLTDIQKRSSDVVAAMKLISDATKDSQHKPLADFSAVPLAAVKAYNDAAHALNTFNLSLDQQIRLTEILQKLQAVPAVIVDQARKKFGDPQQIVIPDIPIATAIVNTGGVQAQIEEAIRALAKEKFAIPIGLNLRLPGEFDVTAALATFEADVKRAQGDGVKLDLVLALGDQGKGLADQIRAATEASLARVQADAVDVIKALPTSGLTPDQQAQAIEELLAKIKKLATATKEVKPPALGLQDFVTAGRGILDIAEGFGKIDSNARQAVRGILDAANALDQFNKAKTAGSVLGEITGGLGIVGGIVSAVSGVIGLFTKGDAERKKIQDEANKILASNNAHLDELGVKIAGWTGSIPDLQKVSVSVNAGGTDAVLKHIQDLASHDTALAGSNQTVIPNRAAFDAFLKGTGISLAQLEAAAHQVGITLYDSAGRIIPGAFAQLQDAIRLTIIDMTRFANTLQDQRSLADLHANVFDLKQSPIDVVDSWLDTFKKIAPAGFSQIFGGIDVHNAAAVKKAEQAWVLAVEAGTVDLAKLGITKDEFIAIVQGMETGFDAVTGAANALTQSLTNIPTGFKVAAFEFAAAATEARRQIGTTTTGPGNAPPTTPFVPSSGTKPQTVSYAITVNIDSGAVVVPASAGADPAETWKVVDTKLRVIARTTGDAIIARIVKGLPPS